MNLSRFCLAFGACYRVPTKCALPLQNKAVGTAKSAAKGTAKLVKGGVSSSHSFLDSSSSDRNCYIESYLLSIL
jgi:hypothetical protein